VEIILLGTRQYEWAVPIFAHLFRKYWSDDQVLWYGDSYTGALPDNIEFRQVPCYREGIWPWTPWFSNGLRSILEDLAGAVIALFLPDHWLTQPVDLAAVDTLRGYMEDEGDHQNISE